MKLIEDNINRTFSLVEFRKYMEKTNTVRLLRDLVDELGRKGLATTAAGNLVHSCLTEKVPYEFTAYNMRAWEYCRIIDICEIGEGTKVFDAGGASSPFTFLCASLGAEVTVYDLQQDLVKNTQKVSEAMGWDINARCADMTETGLEDNTFDCVASISVLEHCPNEIKAKAMREFSRIVNQNGIVSITFDYGRSINAKTEYEYPKYDQFHTPIRSIEEIHKYLIEPSGLEILGNKEFIVEIETDREFNIETWIANKKFKSLARLLTRMPWFDLPYFHYTFFSLFLGKKRNLFIDR